MIIPYLSFPGTCDEAIELYTTVLGAELKYASRYTTQTGGPNMAGKVMHMEIAFKGGELAGADHEGAVNPSDTMGLMIHCENAAEADRIFDAFAKEGQAIQRLTPHPPPDDSGMGALVRDKFGYTWILTAPNDGR